LNPAAKGFIPSGGAATRPYDSQGKALDYSFDMPRMAGGVLMQGFADVYELGSWSPAMVVKFYVEAAKDSLDLVHFNLHNRRSTHFGKKEVLREDGKAYVQIEVNQAGYWYAGDIRALCRAGASFSVISKYRP
jgi:hypothetical protein